MLGLTLESQETGSSCLLRTLWPLWTSRVPPWKYYRVTPLSFFSGSFFLNEGSRRKQLKYKTRSPWARLTAMLTYSCRQLARMQPSLSHRDWLTGRAGLSWRSAEDVVVVWKSVIWCYCSQLACGSGVFWFWFRFYGSLFPSCVIILLLLLFVES